MSIQTQTYIKDMKTMYLVIMNKENKNANDLLFLDIYKKTMA